MHTKWKNSSVGKLFLALGINLVILALTQIFATSYFALYDDVVMNDIAAGYYGEDFSQYLVFPNIIYGFILKFLYSLSHAVNFYGIVQFVLAFFCFWMVSYVFLERYSYVMGTVLSALNGVLFSYFAFISLQFTQLAAICCATGGIVFFYGLKARKTYLQLAGIFQIMAGYWIRDDVFWSTLPFWLILLLRYCLEEGFFKKEHWYKRQRRLFLSSFALIFCLLLSHFIDYKVYEAKDWKEYTEYNICRASILDYELPEYKENEEFYKSIGFSENDVKMLANWNYADNDKYTIENLKKISRYNDSKRKLHLDLKIIQEIGAKIIESGDGFFCVYFAMALSVIALIGLKGYRKWYVVLMWGAVVAEYWYLLCNGRIPQRTYFAIWFMSTIMLLTLLLDNMLTGKKSALIWGTGFLLAATICCFVQYPVINKQQTATNYLEEQERCERLLNDIAKASDNLYLIDCRSIDLPREVFYVLKGSASNYVPLGGWICPTPMYQQILYNYDVENPVRALAKSRENLYYVTQHGNGTVEILTKYLQENYRKKIKAKLVDTCYNYEVYCFTVK